MALYRAHGLRFIRSVGPPDLDHVVGDPVCDEAGALEVLAEVRDEPGVAESNSHLKVLDSPFGADCARLDRSGEPVAIYRSDVLRSGCQLSRRHQVTADPAGRRRCDRFRVFDQSAPSQGVFRDQNERETREKTPSSRGEDSLMSSM